MMLESEPLEQYYASDTLFGLIRSGLTLLNARRVRSRSEAQHGRLHLSDLFQQFLYVVFIIVPAILLEGFQRLRTALTGKPRAFPHGSWQFYLSFGLREDPAHFTNETIGYHLNRPPQASELDDLTAWVMAVIQFVWDYDDLMAAVWDEWVKLRLVTQAAERSGLAENELFVRLQRKWEIARPYNAPLNGTYADIRRAAFEEFIRPRLEALPEALRSEVIAEHKRLAAAQREAFQQQMSLLSYLVPGRFVDRKARIPLWDARIALVVNGRYYLIPIADHDASGTPLVYDYAGRVWPLRVQDGQPYSPDGEQLVLRGACLYRVRDSELVGYLDMTAVSRIKGLLHSILTQAPPPEDSPPLDILLVEAPRRSQQRLRQLLPPETRSALTKLNCAPVIINWDPRPRDRPLAELRRAQRGIGDHALTIMRTESSFIFDQSHVFFDGTWSLAMAEVLTNAAIRWCERCIMLAAAETHAVQPLILRPSHAFLNSAQAQRQGPEISAETTIWDISSIFLLREELARTGTRLTVNDLLVITRIFHAAHYKPSPPVQEAIDAFRVSARTSLERQAVAAIERSLQRGRVVNPALLIPVDASPSDPKERIFPITFRNLTDSLVWIWDDTWDAYQDYRRIDPPTTPEGMAAFQSFALKRTLLIGHLRAFSYVLAASKAVAIRGASINLAILKLLVGLPSWLQHLLRQIPERFPMLNEIIRGDEVYSNVGRVASGSSLVRFMTAKDDGNTKALAWGIMTDDEGRLIVTMRDFRPHVQPLIRAGRGDLARQMAQDYVQTYTFDLMGLVARLFAMLQATPPTNNQFEGMNARERG